MKTEAWLAAILAIITFGAISVGLVAAQQTTGVPGSPDATTTIDGRYIPSPPQPFRGADRAERRAVKAGLAHAGGASKGRAQYPADHD